MRCEVEPSEISSILKFSSSAYSSHINENIERTFGHISKSGLWLYIVHDTIINIYCAETGKWQGGHCFAQSLKNPSAKIRAVMEFTSSHISFPCLILAIEQDHETLLCMFDVSVCNVVQAVLVPDRVTSLDVVSGTGGVCIETHNLCRRLRCMFGIVAVGTLHGHVFFLDLCLDEDFSCDEQLPNITAVVKKNDFSPQKREMALSKKQHIFLHLNEESTSGSSFEFKSRSSILGRFANGDVSVSAVKYIQSLTTLAVGFNFGGIQLWDLHSLMLQFTISDDQHEQAIIRFAFQEPENDPRHFCYLWVVKGHSVAEEALPGSVSIATLYSLTYLKRDYRKEFGALYTELQSCNKRFEFPLTTSAFSSTNTIGTRLLSCQIISTKDGPHSFAPTSANDSGDSVSEDMSVCFLSWEVWPDAEHLPPSYHLAVFDLNQWYQAHMPFSFRGNPNELNSYLGIFSLGEISRKFSNDVMGLYTIPQSVKKFKSLSVSEEFFYPSSLGFQLLCFSESGQCRATYFGFQRHLLFEIAELGPKVLLNPKEIYSSLLKSGLVTDLHGGVERTPLNVQKEAVLQLALEYYLPFFFMKCLKEWRYSESIHEGCTSKAILSWAWKKVISIKSSIDRLSVPLFNCSGTDVDKASLKQLYSFRRQLTLIDSIIEGYQEYVTPRTEQGIQELQCRKEVISSINMYLQVLLWLRSVQVLPEVCEEEATVKSVVYRVGHLEDSFSVRRSRLLKLHSSLAADDVFLIDGMVAESGIGSSWVEKNGTNIYPPPSIYAALGCYLLDGVSIASKHALMFYLLLDLRDMNVESHFPAELKKFPVVFGMSKGMVKLIKAFWNLDRKNSDNALKKLLHPAVRMADIQPWQHQRIVKSFLYWREPQKALKYILHMEPPQSNVEDMKLHLSVLLACGAITQAYEYQRKKQILGHGSEMLNHLFLGCQEMQKLKDLMYLPLNGLESSSLIKFLSESEDPKAQESLVIYHLLHCNFFQASKVNEKLSRALMNKLTSIYESTTHDRTVDRDALVESLMAAISKPERCLVEEIKQFPPEPRKFEETIQPLSVSVKSSAVRGAVTCSNIMESMLPKSIDSSFGVTPDTSAHSKSSTYYQDLPFIGPPVTPDGIRQHFRSGSSAITKRGRISSSPTEISSPAKRCRLLDTAPFKSSPLVQKKTPKSLAGDIVSLLQTPPIHRRTSNLKAGVSQATPTITPQSILKKKAEVKKPIAFDLHLAATPPLLSEEDSSEDVINIDEKQEENVSISDVETPSRQIRFDLPDSPDSNPSPIPDKKVSEELNDDISLTESHNYDLREVQSNTSTQEVGVKSILNLAREPLRGRKKDISFHDEVLSIARDDVSMDFEESVKVPIIVSSIYRHSVSSISFTPDHAVAASTKPSTTSADVLSANVSEYKSSTSNYEAFRSPGVSMFDRSHERSPYLSPQQPLKSECNIFSLPTDKSKNLDTDMEAGLENTKEGSSSAIEKDMSLTPHSDPTLDTSDDHSDNEMFFSPAADNENFNQQPFTFAEPVSLFPEISDAVQTQQSLKEDTQFIDFIEADYSFMDNSNDSDKTITFAFSEPSNDSMEAAAVPKSEALPIASNLLSKTMFSTIDESLAASERDLKPPRRTFVFSKPNTVAQKSKAESEPQVKNKAASDVKEKAEEISYISKTPLETEVKPRKSRIFLFGKDFIERKSQTIETKRSDENIQQAEEKEIEPSLAPKSFMEDVEEKAEEISYVLHAPLETENKPRKSRIFVFGKNFTERKSQTIGTKPPDENIQEAEEKEIERSFVFKAPLTTKIISNPSTTFNVSEKSTDTKDVEDETVLKEQNESSFERRFDSDSSMGVQTSIERESSSKYKFTFTKPGSSETKKETVLKEQKESSFQRRFDSDSSMGVQTSTERESTSKYNFTFSKPDSSETKKQEVKRTLPDFRVPVIESSSPSFQSEGEARPSRKTFVFTKTVPVSKSSSKQRQTIESEIEESLLQSSESQSKDKGEFIKAAAETYEEFSCSLKKKSSKEGLQQPDGNTLRTHEESPAESTQLETSSPIAAVDTKKTKMLKKKRSAKEKASKAVGTTPSLAKNKTKGKLSKKLGFSFAEPNSPATPEILEALAKSPEEPLPSFLFSPPLTRGRLKKKRMDETMESSFCSVASETSFVRPKTPPPVDPLLEGIIASKTLTARKPSKSVSSVKRKTVVRNTMSQSQLNTSNISLISNASLSESFSNSPSKRSSSSRDISMRHSMVLRQTKAKPKPDNLF